MDTPDKKLQSGFTIAETAIVMIVIAVLFLLTLQAVQFIDMAKVKATAAKVKEIESATSIFWDKYNALPGDMPNPGQSLANCADAPCNIGGDNTVNIVGSNQFLDLNNRPGDDPAGTEGERFFIHLKAAELFSDINPALGNVWGGFYPEIAFSGNGMTAASFPSGAAPGVFGPALIDGTNLPIGLYLNIHGGTPSAPRQELEAPFAAMLDRALDDGLPNRGVARARSGGVTACADNTPNADYNGDGSMCGLFVYIGEYKRIVTP